MNIGFDAKRYFHNNTGLGNYSRDLVNTLIKDYPEHNFYLYDSDPGAIKLPSNAKLAIPQGSHFMWRSYCILQDIKLHNLDVYHGLSNELPFGKWPSNTKKIATIHDVIFKQFPNHYPLLDRKIYDRKTKHVVKTADCIIATSNATAKDLITYYKAKENSIKVIYQTCAKEHWKIYTDDELKSFTNERKLPQNYLLYVSSFQTRKNHLQLLKAFKNCSIPDLNLLLVGREGNTYKSCIDFIEQNGLKNHVTILKDVDSKELPLVYRAANAFIYPSMVEGFGIPLIEASCAGLPIAVNNIPVFNELAPEGSTFFNALDVEDFTRAIQVLNERSKSDYSEFLNPFRPSNTASEMMNVYKETKSI